ncbi:MAG: hypothetical protein RIS52_1199 [Pseudomonadota bacterium]
MKLASLNQGRDGRLVVVSDDLAWCADASLVAPTLQAALDAWDQCEPALRNLAVDLAHEAIPMMRFHERLAASPLPRAYHWVRRKDAILCVSRSDGFSAPRDPLHFSGGSSAFSCEAGLVAVIGDVPGGAAAAEASAAIRLVGLYSAMVTNNGEMGDYATTFSPVFVTPDTLGTQWSNGALQGGLSFEVNGAACEQSGAGAANKCDFGPLIAAAASARALGAGTLVGVASATHALSSGDTVRLWMDDEKHHPLFGVIEQSVSLL